MRLIRWHWLDLDDDRAAERAEMALDAAHFTPHLKVTTGRTPHLRRQFWWRLAEPCPLDRARDLMRRLAAALGADPSPVIPSRVMRLAGSIAWPKSHKPGRVVELVTLDAARSGAVMLWQRRNVRRACAKRQHDNSGSAETARAPRRWSPV